MTVDACVAIKWFYEEEMNAEADRLLGESYTISALSFLLLEFSHFLLRKRRKGEITLEESLEAQKVITVLFDEFISTDLLIHRAIQIATQINHSPYDSLYLAAAEYTQSILVTADREFFNRVASSEYSPLIAWIENLPQ